MELENNYFTNGRFGQRPDGHFCILKDPELESIPGNMICLPESKGRSKHTNEQLTPENEKFLYEYYKESNLRLEFNIQ